jgi:hypothetical protein
MRLTLLTAAAVIGCTLSVHAQTTTLGTLRPSSTVVTQEVDTVALAALSASNTAARAAITNEALYRAQADAANLAEMLASNAVATAAIAAEALTRYVAITNEAAIRASGDVAVSNNVTAATNALDAATIARDYPRSNPSNWITSVTATNIAQAVVVPYTNGAALGATAVQPADLQTLLDGKLNTNGLTAPIIAAGGGVTNGFYPLPGCLPLGTNTAFSITGTHSYYSATMAGVSTVTVTRAASSGFTYCLSIIGTNALILANANTLNTWTLGGTNTYIFSPTCAGTWVSRGMTP